MNNISYLAIIAIFFVSCQSDKPTEVVETETPVIEETMLEKAIVSDVLSPEVFATQLESASNYYLIDVRTPQELEELPAIENAINIDIYDANFKAKLAELDTEKTVYIYCRSGKRSAQSAAILTELGFTEIHDLAGGILAWNQNKN